MTHDCLLKFMFDHTPVRGEVVSLQTPWRHIVGLHDFAPRVREVLGEMLAASALLSSTLKFEGALVMQLQGDGPVKLLVAECHADLGMRATAKVVGDAPIPDDLPLQQLLNPNGGARMAITLDPRDRQPGQQPYQGIVPVEGDSVAAMLENYMLRSEQIETRLWLASDAQGAAGLLMQRMPSTGGHAVVPTGDDDTWARTVHLSETIQRAELLALAPETIVRRLFWQEEHARLFEPRTARFACSCSREKVGNMLLTLGREEVDSVIEELGEVNVHCEYCNAAYRFDRVDVGQLFASSGPATGTAEPDRRQH